MEKQYKGKALALHALYEIIYGTIPSTAYSRPSGHHQQ